MEKPSSPSTEERDLDRQQQSSLPVVEKDSGRQQQDESLCDAEQLFGQLSIQSTWLDECK